MTKNILKVIFLGIIGFSILVYLTAPQNSKNEKIELNTKFFPRFFNIISSNKDLTYQNLFNLSAKEKILVVLNHDTLLPFSELSSYTNREDIVLLANVSNTPWLIKQLAVNDKLVELFANSKIPLVVGDGNFIKVLNLNDITQNRYFVYKISSNGDIKSIFNGEVKLNSLEKGNSKEEVENTIKSFLSKI